MINALKRFYAEPFAYSKIILKYKEQFEEFHIAERINNLTYSSESEIFNKDMKSCFVNIYAECRV